MNKFYYFLIGSLLMIAAISHQATAQIPKIIAYQGVLTNASGVPVVDSTYFTAFRFYNPESTVIWEETRLVQTRRGLFSVLLGSVTPFPDSLKFDRAYRLGIQISGEAQLVPLIPLNSVGYSLSSLRSDTAKFAQIALLPDSSIDSSKLANQSVTGEKLRDSSIQSRHLSRDIRVPNADSVDGIGASFGQLPNTLFPLNSNGGITLVSNPAALRSLSVRSIQQTQGTNAFISLFSGAAGCAVNLIPGIGPTASCLIEKGIEVTTEQLVTGALIRGNTTGVEAVSDAGTALWAHTSTGQNAIFAESNSGTGVYAHSLSASAATPALYAKHDGGGRAGQFDGPVQVNGNLTFSGSLSGLVGGDLSGTFPTPSVARIQGTPVVSPLSPSTGQVLQWNGSQWAPATVSGGVSGITSINSMTGPSISVSGGTGISISNSSNTVTVSNTSLFPGYGGNGSATTVSRSDHNHFGASWSGSGVGLTLSSTTASSLSGSSSADFGIVGTSSATNKAGVKGDGGSTSYGVAGYSSNSSLYAGVYGKNLTTNAQGALANGGVGVYGTGSTWAGSFDGNVNVSNGYLNVAWTGGGSTNAINSTNNGAYSAVNGVNTGSGIGVRGESQGTTGSGVYAKKTNGNYALYVEGAAYFTGLATFAGSKSGYVVDICYNAGTEVLEQGDVVEIIGSMDPVIGEIPVAKVQKCRSVGSSRVMGVVENRYDVKDSSHSIMPIRPGDYVSVVTLGAFKIINVDATPNAIQPGDLLTSSGFPGYAMRADKPSVGTVIGKALEPLPTGRGKIKVFVSAK